MAQKGRNDITTAINSNIYDNNNKEILAQMVRAVMQDFRDSHFNLKDDELANIKYNSNTTLSQKLDNSANLPPLWGSTDYFDVGSTNGSIVAFGDNGIVQNMNYIKLTKNDCELTLTLSKSIANRKICISMFTNSTDLDANNDICCPVIRIVDSQTVKVALREVSGNEQSIRLELLAFQVNKGD